MNSVIDSANSTTQIADLEQFFNNIKSINFTNKANHSDSLSVFSSAIFYVLVAGVSGFLILCATILCFTYWFLIKRKTSPVLEGSLSDLSFQVHGTGGAPFGEENEIDELPKCAHPPEETSLMEPPSWANIDVNKLKSQFADITVSDQSVERCKPLQEGTFSALYVGLFHKPHNFGVSKKTAKGQITDADNGPPRKAFIKTFIRQATQVQITTMLQDALLLKGVVHKHLMSPVAVSFHQPSCLPQIVYPSASYGNLKKVLLISKWPSGNNRPNISDSNLVFSVRNLIEIASQVLKAIRHLHRVSIVHKDIAARNCFLTSGTDGMRVRLCDSCLSRDLFPDEYHCLLDNENRPVRWLALEALDEKLYSRASDVWSFAVFLWELFTLGQMPYADVDPFEMSSVLADGLRVQKPPNCPDHIYNLMVCCWLLQPDQRPSIEKICDFLQMYVSQSPL